MRDMNPAGACTWVLPGTLGCWDQPQSLRSSDLGYLITLLVPSELLSWTNRGPMRVLLEGKEGKTSSELKARGTGGAMQGGLRSGPGGPCL